MIIPGLLLKEKENQHFSVSCAILLELNATEQDCVVILKLGKN